MKVLFFLLVLLLTSCSLGRPLQCSGAYFHHKLVQDARGEIKLPNGDRMVIFICVRKDYLGNAACGYTDTFYIRK